jgi:RNA-dependent RNA polymerase
MIDRLDSMLTKIEVAVELLPSLSGPDSGLVSFLLHMLYSGWSPDADPFLFNALHAIRQHHLFALRKKARVFVKEGAVLMGGLDETGLLKDGEVFVQVSKWDPSNPGKLVHKIITGLVMVTKHPALHTGDVRMLRAVDVPQLQGQRNVILFSQHGDRPEADKMSGSDLDGDQFAVTWDDRLFLQGPNHSPLDFDNLISTKSSLMPSNTSEHDRALVQHFVNHVMNDNVGRIAMLWLDYASKYGANCNKCVELARLHSIAVDFPKSGIPANVPRELILPPDFKVGHWREAKGRASEHCDSIIGRMYDQVIGRDKDSAFLYSKSALAARKIDSYGRIISWFESTEQGKNALQDIYRDDVPSSLGLDAFSVPEKELYLEMAAEMYGEYEGDIRTLMNKYTIQSEGELFTGCIRKYHKLHKKKQFSIAEEVRRSCRELRKEYRQWFFDCVLNFVGGPPELNQDSHDPREISEDEGEILDRIEVAAACISLETVQSMSEWEIEVRRFAFALAAVCYLTTYSPDRVVTRGKSALFGLPWLVADVIHAGLDDFASRNQ